MSYTAYETMRQKNLERFRTDCGPIQPDRHFAPEDNRLKSSALRFLHDRCEGLKFSPAITASEQGGDMKGTGFMENQIPYDMQMDTNRLCLERELERFIDSGVAEDAYNVYYCYLEMFFGHYGKSKKMVELLSEFESNGSSLLMKHRDHYSHSVYVFALGLAVYDTNAFYRSAFKRFYGFNVDENDLEADHAAANAFLEYWGMSALFHDIGYPFELPFEEVLSYFEVDHHKRGKGSVYIAYRDIGSLTGLSAEEQAHFRELFGRDFADTNELFAHAIAERLGGVYGIDEAALVQVLRKKPLDPNEFGYFMDHAWFSAARLYREIADTFGVDGVTRQHIDVLTAILLHNSLYKFAIAFFKSADKAKPPLKMELHPLAFLLMLCDELQCWDRTAYGRNSRKELHPMGADFDFSGNAIRATYYYDSEEHAKIDAYEAAYHRYELQSDSGAEPPRLKAYSDMAESKQRFRTDIELIVDTADIPLTVIADVREANRKVKHTYLSDSSFLHLYDFAVALNARYNYQGDEDDVAVEQLEEEFERLSLEYQLSNINQAKSFSRYLNAIGCFYTDRPVDFDIITKFTPEQTETFAPMEHERWVSEHRSMGWRRGDEYETVIMPDELKDSGKSMYYYRRAFREQMRTHKLAMDGDPSPQEILDHYDALPETEKGKDWEPFNSMLKLIKKYDGLRIYRFQD